MKCRECGDMATWYWGGLDMGIHLYCDWCLMALIRLGVGDQFTHIGGKESVCRGRFHHRQRASGGREIR